MHKVVIQADVGYCGRVIPLEATYDFLAVAKHIPSNDHLELLAGHRPCVYGRCALSSCVGGFWGGAVCDGPARSFVLQSDMRADRTMLVVRKNKSGNIHTRLYVFLSPDRRILNVTVAQYAT